MKKRALFGLMVRGFIEKNGKILLAKEKKERTWETPGGSVRLHETLKRAIKREVLEETGYSIKIEKMMLTDIGGSKLIKEIKVLCIIYKVKLLKKIRKPLPDVVGIRWFSKNEIKDMLKRKKVDWHDKKIFKIFVR
ncbi:MAG: NUDIX domain-containing protein [Candidatus Aenigmarchaeota archaeon]|nr:NUDIX domain-containing protein [Candidatus Aenigmarchaeota archaeon]